MSGPIRYRWSGDGWEPLPRFRRQCNETFVIGETANLELREERSGQSHRHLFAQIADAWGTLPAAYDNRFPSPEHLRAFLLIKGGFCRHVQHACPTRAEALRTRAICAGMDDYAIVSVEGSTVNVFTAESMNYSSMDRQRFQAAKDACLRILDEMLGVDSGATAANAAQAA